ncbi:neuroblastoma breakpoint family member 12 isoform X2 [Lemur catta]|uniref:neuroblastoma breakpoint family member 12 isoform X2 n=1 Tax=Lemur catta TaxID=9447 RepID=UPI001E26725C|nr:neuroblastoma breakpoint family member 12 isoform X2 [Lemur catta]
MAVPLTTFSGQRAEMSVLETNRYLRSQLEESKQKFLDLTEKYLTSTAMAYCLANHLQKHKCEEYKDLIESVLEEELQYKERKLVEKRTAARLGKYDPLIQAQAQELTNLRQKIQEGRSFCYLFTQHVKNTVKSFEGLLRNTDIARYQGQRLCEQLAQGSQLTESLASKLSSKNHNGKTDEDTQELLVPSLSRNVQEAELKDSLDERYLTYFSCHDSHQPLSSNTFLFDEWEATSALDVAKDEIQNLQQHLRETLFINDCLREKLEYHFSIFDQRNGNN